jgi:acetolactate synthase-1/2/3 large subunit
MGIPNPGKVLIHVHAAAEELGRVFRPTLPIQSGMPEFAAAAAALEPVPALRWSSWRAAARTDYEEALVPSAAGGVLDLGKLMAWLRDHLPDDAIITSDAGNFSGWPNRFLQYRRPGRQLGPTSGAMGYGVPAAVAAAAVDPSRPVVCIAGDGDFLMTGQELATAVQHELPIVVIVVDNGMYGTIRMHQEREFPGRVSGTELVNPDFAAYAQAFGAHGEAVEDTAGFEAAFERALAAGRPALISVRVDPDAITPRTTLTALRSAALERVGGTA